MAQITDFSRKLYKSRQETGDSVQRRLYQIAEMARINPTISAARAIFIEELGIKEQIFDQMFVSYWMALEIGRKSSNWNLEDEPMMRSVGITEQMLLIARTDLSTAVLNRVFLRVAVDGLATRERGSDEFSKVATSSPPLRNLDGVDKCHEAGISDAHAKLVSAFERTISAMIDEGFRNGRGQEVVARLINAQKTLEE